MAVTCEKVVKIALACNLIIFATKGVAAWISGSAALFSETLHSLADCMNSIFLLIGISRAAKPADRTHPFGYTRAIYFWSFMGALFMFSIIASLSMVRGYQQIAHGEELAYANFAIASLVVSLALEAVAVSFAVRGIYCSTPSHAQGRRGLLANFRLSQDPAVKVVFIEDMLSFSGVIIAMAGIAGASFFGLRWLDGYAAVAIGFLIGIFGVFLMNENRRKLLGEAASPEMEEEIRRHALADTEIQSILSLKTIQVGSNRVMVYLVVELDPGMEVEELDDVTYSLEKRIIREIPEVIDCFIEVVSTTCEPCKERIRRKDGWMLRGAARKEHGKHLAAKGARPPEQQPDGGGSQAGGQLSHL